jgi:hypothetical protein
MRRAVPSDRNGQRAALSAAAKNVNDLGGLFDTKDVRCVLIGLALMCAATGASALDAGQINGAAAGMGYAEVRARLLEFGYAGRFSQRQRKCHSPSSICTAYPTELDTCSGTGTMPCRFVFSYPRGRTVVVITQGPDLKVTLIVEEQ